MLLLSAEGAIRVEKFISEWYNLNVKNITNGNLAEVDISIVFQICSRIEYVTIV